MYTSKNARITYDLNYFYSECFLLSRCAMLHVLCNISIILMLYMVIIVCQITVTYSVT